MTSDDLIQIQEGRHPLQELSVPAFVPNDCRLPTLSYAHPTQDQSRIIWLTGSNSSGKSVFLKQVACIVFLAHIGSFVPAKSALIGITDRILARIITKESVEVGRSAFAIDLAQLVNIFKSWTSRSLIIVDEFGKGTNCDDGSGLLASFVEYFLYQKGSIPKILVATHFHEVSRAIKESARLQLAHMAVSRNKQVHATREDVVFLFKVRRGLSNSSLGTYCAQLNGVPDIITSRADAIALLLSRQEDIRISCTKLTPAEEKRLQAAEHVSRHFLGYDFADLKEGAKSEEGSARQSLGRLLRSPGEVSRSNSINLR